MAKKDLNTPGRFSNGISGGRKLEILGILLMAIAFLLGLSIFSYNASDYGQVQHISFLNYFNPDSSLRGTVANLLGPIGAYLAYFFVHILFGYISMIIPVVLFFSGWHIFRHRSPRDLTWTSIISLFGMINISAILGWTYTNYESISSVWAGAAGIAIAKVLQNILGIGSIILLGVFFVILFLLLLDRDLQSFVDTFKHWVEDMRIRIEDYRSRMAEKREKRKREKEEKRKARKEASEASTNRSDTKNTNAGQTKSIDDIVEESQKEDQERVKKQREAVKGLDQRSRAVLEKEVIAEPEDEEDDVEMAVFKGEGDEQADARELDKKNREKAKDVPVIKYRFPGIDLLDSPPNEGNEVDLEEIKENKRIILDKLKRHKIEILSINAIVGPTVTLYELEPSPDVKISKIQSYASDLKMATAAHGIRIIAPIPGKSAVGIEVPNSTRETVYFKEMINTKKFVETDKKLPVAFGKTIENEVFMIDLTKMPHLLIAGATGSGKSVGINTIISCLLYKSHPDDLKFVMIDPKKIELSLYRNIQNHFLAVLPGSDEPIVTDTTKAKDTLESLTKEMDERYDLLKMAMVRDIASYNEKFKTGELDEELGHRHLPYIVVIIDELADLMMTAGKQIEEPIARLAQLARAIGIHLVVATQRPSVNVITGTIKANFPARIAYQVASKVDSRTILDTGGADQLIGRGDMLFNNGAGMTRIQNAFVSTEEVERITSFIGRQTGYKEPFYLPVIEDESMSDIPDPLDDIDDMFEAAAKIVILHQQGSVSLLQRKLKIGYNRAGRIIDQLFNAGIVGPYQGSTARDVLVDSEEELQEILDELDGVG